MTLYIKLRDSKDFPPMGMDFLVNKEGEIINKSRKLLAFLTISDSFKVVDEREWTLIGCIKFTSYQGLLSLEIAQEFKKEDVEYVKIEFIPGGGKLTWKLTNLSLP